MRIALAQIDTTVGDFDGNRAKVLEFYERARDRADLVVFPELCLSGYAAFDLHARRDFLAASEQALEELVPLLGGPAVVIGSVRRNPGEGRPAFNSAAVIEGGEIIAWRDKVLLPTYDVFDEDRYFEPGATNTPVSVAGRRIGVLICEDLWRHAPITGGRYHRDPGVELAERGADLLVCPSASPFHRDKEGRRESVLLEESSRLGLPIAVCNQVGGNTGILFDGASFVAHPAGVLVRGARFEEDLVVFDTDSLSKPEPTGAPDIDVHERVAEGLVRGIADYFRKCGVGSAIVGLSGGIDSAVTASLAVDALGAENVRGVGMPARYSSPGSITDAQELAIRLGIPFELIDIDGVFGGLLEVLPAAVAGTVAEENLQARVRGVVLMALSNLHGSMVLATGNKSEFAVGYCTLYGDMCGALAPIGDVLKTDVYALARLPRFIDRIPRETLLKAPSAELRPDQTDQDNLPAYEQLDPIIRAFVEEEQSREQIEAGGRDPGLVRRVVGLIEASEYKRRQAPPTLRVSPRAFGLGRRVPIARHWPR